MPQPPIHLGFRRFCSLRSGSLDIPSPLPEQDASRQAENLWRDWLFLSEGEREKFAQEEELDQTLYERGVQFAVTDRASLSSSSSSSSLPSPSSSPSSPSASSIPELFDYMGRRSVLNLEDLRLEIIKQEETLIFALMERSQFRQNPPLYSSSSSIAVKGESFLDWYIHHREMTEAQIRRFTSPDEHPFSSPSSLPAALLPLIRYPQSIKPNAISLNDQVKIFYLQQVVPQICQEGDDFNYGSAASLDFATLHALSRRIHFGKFVAETKFRADENSFAVAIRTKDRTKLMELVTKAAVEQQILKRVFLKAAAYGQEPSLEKEKEGDEQAKEKEEVERKSNTDLNKSWAQKQKARHQISPEVIAKIYEQIIHMNKLVQVEYLLQRLD